MKVLINRRPIEGPYGGGNLFVRAAFEYLPKFGYTPVTSFAEQPEIILMIDPRPDELGIGINEIAHYRAKWLGTERSRIVVHRINECDARKGTDDMDRLLWQCQRYVDERVFVSDWLCSHLLDAWVQTSNPVFTGRVIHNGVDGKIFHPSVPDSDEKTLIVTHHWSDNPMKGLDITVWLDDYFIPKYRDQFEYTYIGRLKVKLKNSTMVAPLFGQELANELAAHHVYVSASRFDPGPNHVLEALSCGLCTYVHQNGGGAVEFAGEDHTYSTPDELEQLLLQERHISNAFQPINWEECIKQYANTFDELTSCTP